MLLCLTLVLFLACYVLFKHHYNYWNQYKEIPNVPGKIFSGNFRDFLSFKTNFAYHLKTIYDDPKFDTAAVVGVYGLYKPSLLIKDPGIIKSVLIKDFDCFHNRFAKMDEIHDPLGTKMMFFSQYPLWKEMRSKFSSTFSSAKMKLTYPLIQKVGENISAFLDKQGPVYRTEMKEFCSRYTSDVLASTIFGVESNSLTNPEDEIMREISLLTYFTMRRAFDLLIVCFASKLSRFFGSKIMFDRTESFLRAFVTQTVSERECSGLKRNDIIDIFVKLKKEAHQNGDNIPKLMECLEAQAGIFMAGGFDTSSTTMSNCLLEMAKAPELQKRLRQEICDAFAAENGQISYESIDKLTYLDMVVNETIRMYPVFPVLERQYSKPDGRDKPYTLEPYCNFSLPEGMPVFISTYGLHYDPKYWHNPTTFNPERFSEENKHSINPMVYLPFGNGPRNCIGVRLGMLQVKTGLLYFLRDHYVRVYEETVIEPEFDPKATILQIKGGIYLEIVRDKMKDMLNK